MPEINRQTDLITMAPLSVCLHGIVVIGVHSNLFLVSIVLFIAGQQ